MNTETHTSETNELPPLGPDEELKLQNDIMAFIDKNLRPSIVMDGGDITICEFNKLTNNKYEVVVQLMGACVTCPASTFTMRMGVERMLLQSFDRIEMVSQAF